jgi:DNA-binding HxlR family transcriptional regulator
MDRNVRTYDHFCLVARTLEQVGAKRFTDLTDRLRGITPKTLSQRLRELEEAGLVTVDRAPGRREVFYRLTAAGADLGPVIEGFNWWGLRHAWRWPRDGEPLHAEHLLRCVIQSIDLAAGEHRAARWHFRLDGADYLAESDGSHWSLTAGPVAGPADVTVTGTTWALAEYIFTGGERGIDVAGESLAVQRLREVIGTMATVVNPGVRDDEAAGAAGA